MPAIRSAFIVLRCAASLAGGLAFAAPAGSASLTASTLADLTLEQLREVVVSTVSRGEERLDRAAASVYVISAEDIRRSGATTLPEALRLAPNLHVARADANQYAISARGFNNVLANKMLVLIDGRTVYSPLFSGVFWEAQDLMLEDVERIEVISGPAATLWGSNAVNGVINVITRPASATQGARSAASMPAATGAARRCASAPRSATPATSGPTPSPTTGARRTVPTAARSRTRRRASSSASAPTGRGRAKA